MKKSIKFIIIIAIFLIICFFLTPKGIQLTIKNETGESLYNLSLEILSGTSEKYIPIESVGSGEVTVLPVELPDEFIEGSIFLCYYDKNNNKQKETVIGYVEQGYNVNIQVSIESIDSDGNLKISVH